MKQVSRRFMLWLFFWLKYMAQGTIAKRRAELSESRSFQRGKLIQSPDADGNCLASRSPPDECRERQNLPQESAAGRPCLSNRPIARPATCFPSSRQTDRFVGLSQRRGSRRSFAVSPRDCLPTGSRHYTQLIVALEAVLHASRGQNLLRPPDSTTKRKEAEGRRNLQLATASSPVGGCCIESPVVKAAVVVVVPSNVVVVNVFSVAARQNADRAAMSLSTITTDRFSYNSIYRLSTISRSDINNR